MLWQLKAKLYHSVIKTILNIFFNLPSDIYSTSGGPGRLCGEIPHFTAPVVGLVQFPATHPITVTEEEELVLCPPFATQRHLRAAYSPLHLFITGTCEVGRGWESSGRTGPRSPRGFMHKNQTQFMRLKTVALTTTPAVSPHPISWLLPGQEGEGQFLHATLIVKVLSRITSFQTHRLQWNRESITTWYGTLGLDVIRT